MRVDIQEQKRFPTYIADLEVGAYSNLSRVLQLQRITAYPSAANRSMQFCF
jgi:hypothetical protein